MTIDMSKYVELFLSEAHEHLTALSSELVQFERQRDAATLDSLFRHAHSMKGMAASMGYEATAVLSHKMEDVLSLARAAPARLHADAIDALLQATDALRIQVQCVADGRPLSEFPEVLEKLGQATHRLSLVPSAHELEAEKNNAFSVVPHIVGQGSPTTVRVKAELLDECLDTVGELLLATSRIRELSKLLAASHQPSLEEASYKLFKLARNLHEKVVSARLMPISNLTQRLPRACRDIARKEMKQVELSITGADIEMDRSLLEELGDPLLHLIRNAISHGIETPDVRSSLGKPPSGLLRISIRREHESVVLDVEDDGQGMNAQKLRDMAVARGAISQEDVDLLSDSEAWMLCCLPGVSTADVVSDISGRGVGMDVVKRAVENLGGRLSISSNPNAGTRFSLRVPMTVAVAHLLLVQVGNETFGIPITKVAGVFDADSSQVRKITRGFAVEYNGEWLSAFGLDELLQLPSLPRIGRRPWVVVETDGKKIALAVDALRGQEEMVLKALSKPLDHVLGLGAVALLGNGRPVFILDVPRLLAA